VASTALSHQLKERKPRNIMSVNKKWVLWGDGELESCIGQSKVVALLIFKDAFFAKSNNEFLLT